MPAQHSALNSTIKGTSAGSRNLTTDSYLIEQAGLWGYGITGRQLERWRTSGLLPPLKARGKGRGRGQERFYLDDPSRQFRVILDFRKAGVPIAECAIRLWLADFPVALNDVRRHLPYALKKLRRFRGFLQSTNFAERFAEYLQHTPRSRQTWFAEKPWDRERYNDAVEIGAGASEAFSRHSASKEPKEHFRTFAAPFTKLTESERHVVAQLGADPDNLVDGIPVLYGKIFERLEWGTDAELLAAKEAQKLLLRLSAIAVQIEALFPNPVSSLLTRVALSDDLHSSYGLFAGLGIILQAKDRDAIAELKSAINQFEPILLNLIARDAVPPGVNPPLGATSAG